MEALTGSKFSEWLSIALQDSPLIAQYAGEMQDPTKFRKMRRSQDVDVSTNNSLIALTQGCPSVPTSGSSSACGTQAAAAGPTIGVSRESGVAATCAASATGRFPSD